MALMLSHGPALSGERSIGILFPSDRLVLVPEIRRPV